jgi:hypothetical protein
MPGNGSPSMPSCSGAPGARRASTAINRSRGRLRAMDGASRVRPATPSPGS